MPRIVSDVTPRFRWRLAVAAAPIQAQQTDGQPFAAMLDATTAAPTPPPPPANPPPNRLTKRPTNRPRRQPGTLRALVLPASPRPAARARRPTRLSSASAGVQLTWQRERGVQFDRQREHSVQLDQRRERRPTRHTASSAPEARAAFNPRSSANAGSDVPAGTKGSGNLKTNTNTGFNPTSVTGGNATPQATPSVPPNANTASGTKPQTVATAATTNNADTTVPVNAGLPAVQQTGVPAPPITKAFSNDGKADDGKARQR